MVNVINMNEFGIFLIPKQFQYKKYTKLINSLSKEYKSLDFDAHLTLIGSVKADKNELIDSVKYIAKNYKKINVKILGLNFSNTFYKCVFAQIEMNSQLLTLFNALKIKLKYKNENAFFPHMSLVYGDFSPEERENIARKIVVGKNLELDKLVIVKSGPVPSDWDRIVEFELM